MLAYTQLHDNYTALQLGTRIRDERKRRGWTLAELAAKLSLSVGTLSSLENQKLSVHVNLLLAISNVFAVPLDVLLPKSPTSHFHITRRGHTESQPPLPMMVVNRATQGLTSYHNKLWPLARPFVGKYLEPFEIEVQPVADGDRRFISHNHEEFVFVLRGRIQCLIKTPDGLTEATLSAGDCIYFWSYLPHCIRSLDQAPARTIHIEYSPDEIVDAEYGTSGAGQTVYLADAGQENLVVQIAGKIVALRKARGMSAAQFAQEVGVGVRRLKQVESATRPLTIDFLLRVCRTFQKPLEYFLSPPPVQRPFSYVLRARDIRRAGTSGNGAGHAASDRACASLGRAIPLAGGFPGHGMHPLLLRLDRKNGPAPLAEHAGQEFLYVLRGAVRFTTRQRTGELVEETLLPGDACFIDSSVAHSLKEMQFTPYEPAGAELLVVRYQPAAPAAAARQTGVRPPAPTPARRALSRARKGRR